LIPQYISSDACKAQYPSTEGAVDFAFDSLYPEAPGEFKNGYERYSNLVHIRIPAVNSLSNPCC